MCGLFVVLELAKHPVEGFSAGLVDDSNVYEWQVVIVGPPDTLYEGIAIITLILVKSDFVNEFNFVSFLWY
jgi:ubiquitin-conjugating enzyme E2 G1